MPSELNTGSLFDELLPSKVEAMSRLRYIGSKARFAEEILNVVGSPHCPNAVFVDIFSGTGIVSRYAAAKGWAVRANDHLFSSATVTQAQLLSERDVPFLSHDGYACAIKHLNATPPFQGFVYREYAPTGLSGSGNSRMYFTPENAARIDGMRLCIEKWFVVGSITSSERSLLIADLLGSANSVANIAGTYGCFLRRWNSNALHSIELPPRRLTVTPCRFEVTNKDAFEVETSPCDVVYLDPPYTKRQYAAYYHILETIAVGDAPVVEGVTGLRPWQEKFSLFCYKTKALSALDDLISGIKARRILLSYSSEGHIPFDKMKQMLSNHGSFVVHAIENVGRYRPNLKASESASNVTEYVFDLIKTAYEEKL